MKLGCIYKLHVSAKFLHSSLNRSLTKKLLNFVDSLPYSFHFCLQFTVLKIKLIFERNLDVIMKDEKEFFTKKDKNKIFLLFKHFNDFIFVVFIFLCFSKDLIIFFLKGTCIIICFNHIFICFVV